MSLHIERNDRLKTGKKGRQYREEEKNTRKKNRLYEKLSETDDPSESPQVNRTDRLKTDYIRRSNEYENARWNVY